MDNEEYLQIKRETELGIKRGWDAAHIGWREEALKVLLDIALHNPTFSANDLTGIIKALPEKTRDNRAIAGVILAGRRLKWIAGTGETEMSKAGHFSRVQIWRSLIYGKKVEAPAEKQSKLF